MAHVIVGESLLRETEISVALEDADLHSWMSRRQRCQRECPLSYRV